MTDILPKCWKKHLDSLTSQEIIFNEETERRKNDINPLTVQGLDVLTLMTNKLA